MNTRNLFKAVQKGPNEIFFSLLKEAGDVNCRDARGNTPLLVALRKQRYVIVSYLLDHGADVCLAGKNGYTPLTVAAYGGSVALCEKLLSLGAEVNACNAYGCSPLMAAAITGNVAVVRCLLQHGADASLKNVYGCSACMLAHMHGRKNVVDLLATYGVVLHPTTATVLDRLHESGSVRAATCKHPIHAAVFAADTERIVAFRRLGIRVSAEEAKKLILAAIGKLPRKPLTILFEWAQPAQTREDICHYLRKTIETEDGEVFALCKWNGLLPLLTDEDANALIATAFHSGSEYMAEYMYSRLRVRGFEDDYMRMAVEADMYNVLTQMEWLFFYILEGKVSLARSTFEEEGVRTPLAKNYMMVAIKKADAPMLACILDFVGSVFTPEEMRSYMQHAICSRCAESVRLLMARNFFTALSAPAQQALVRLAIKEDCADILLQLTEAASPRISPDSLLESALELESLASVRAILAQPDFAAQAKQSILGPALIEAAHDGNLSKVRFLLDCGAGADFTDANSRTPFNQALKRGIFYACINGSFRGRYTGQVHEHRLILELLLEHGATLHAIEKHAELPAPRMQGIMLNCGFSVYGYKRLITDRALAEQIFSRLPHTLTWI